VFFAFCGGLLGLFLGVSLISVVEILYFCTIRLLCFKIQNQVQDVPEQHEARIKTQFNCFQLIRDLATDYSKRTTIQGVNYMTDNARPLIERLWWLVVFVLSVSCCGLFISDVYERYDQSPIIVKFADAETPISDVG
jgi:Amiloride-sensitive sodium channel